MHFHPASYILWFFLRVRLFGNFGCCSPKVKVRSTGILKERQRDAEEVVSFQGTIYLELMASPVRSSFYTVVHERIVATMPLAWCHIKLVWEWVSWYHYITSVTYTKQTCTKQSHEIKKKYYALVEWTVIYYDNINNHHRCSADWLKINNMKTNTSCDETEK